MKRKIYQNLLEWKEKGMKKPLMIIGARQVGKTYIVQEFCKNEFENYLYTSVIILNVQLQILLNIYQIKESKLK